MRTLILIIAVIVVLVALCVALFSFIQKNNHQNKNKKMLNQEQQTEFIDELMDDVPLTDETGQPLSEVFDPEKDL